MNNDDNNVIVEGEVAAEAVIDAVDPTAAPVVPVVEETAVDAETPAEAEVTE